MYYYYYYLLLLFGWDLGSEKSFSLSGYSGQWICHFRWIHSMVYCFFVVWSPRVRNCTSRWFWFRHWGPFEGHETVTSSRDAVEAGTNRKILRNHGWTRPGKTSSNISRLFSVLLIAYVSAWVSSRMVANLSISAVWSGHLLWLLCSNCICSWTCEINMTYLPLLSFYNVLLIVYVRARACCCVAYVGFKIDHCSSIVYCS